MRAFWDCRASTARIPPGTRSSWPPCATTARRRPVRRRGPTEGARSYDTELYSARVTHIWVWEADDHDAYRLLIDAFRETPLRNRYFEVVDLLAGTENGYGRT
ncbi:darcynin family protein [Streptomyces sp. NPDC048383]|uniref:darcynin family protein n=1 Tax=Streptomyces sp. NPDC048383 TaxID=3155386 RepID=UPI00343765CC